MWFGKDIMTKLGLVLAMAVPALAAEVDPLRFAKVGPDESILKDASGKPILVDADLHQPYWNKLMSFKMWGTDSIYLGRAQMPSLSGAVGTAKGLKFKDDNHFIGGPIYVGHDFEGAQGNDTIVSGPVRVNGSFKPGANTNILHGKYCLGGYNDFAERDIKNTKLTHYEKPKTPYYGDKGYDAPEGVLNQGCSDAEVSEVPVYLTIPDIPEGTLIPSDAASIIGNVSVSKTYIIDVPPMDGGKKMYDFYIDGSINIETGSKLIVRMQSSKSLARFFMTGSLNITSSSQIQVVYVENAEYEYVNPTTHLPKDGKYGQWVITSETVQKPVKNEGYDGNLLFHCKGDISWPAMNPPSAEDKDDGGYVQGSILSTGTIDLGSNLVLAGQLLATRIIIQNEFNGKSFRYVPFDPPVLEPTAGGGNVLYEGHKSDKVKIELDKDHENNITFDYCFQFEGVKKTGTNYAMKDDLTDDLPIYDPSTKTCSKTPLSSGFAAGSLTLDKPIELHVADDEDLENEYEEFKIWILNLDGAVLTNGEHDGYIPLKIKDNDSKPLGADYTVVGIEDTPYYFDAFKVTNSSGKAVADYSVRIETLPSAGSLVLLKTDGSDSLTLDSGDEIPASIINADPDVGKFVFKFDKDDYTEGPNPDPKKAIDRYNFEFRVVYKGNASENAYKALVTIDPRNDRPYAENTVFEIPENSVTTEGDTAFASTENADGAFGAVDVDDPVLKYKFDDNFDDDNTEENYKHVTEIYGINPTTGKIYVKEEKTLNYESADSVLSIRVIISDLSVSTGNEDDILDTAVIATIKILDVDEPPHFDNKNPEFAVNENSLAGDSVGIVVAVDDDCKDDDCSDLVYELIAADTDKDHLDDYKEFAIDEKTGKITVVRDSSLNYEVKDLYQVRVVVYDGDKESDKTLTDTAYVTINVNDLNDKPIITNQEFEVVENVKVGTRVDSVEASDEDHWAKLSYTLLDVEPTDKVAHLFDISSTGIITVSKDGDGVLDYETRKEYKVWVKVTDNGEEKGFENLSDSAIITIKIKDENEKPGFDDDYEFAVDENSAAGTEVGVASANDDECKKTSQCAFEYVLIADSDEANASDLSEFVIDKTTGKITLANSNTLNYEVDDLYYVRVVAFDGDPLDPQTLSDTARVTIKVNDVNDKPEIKNQEFAIVENASVGDKVDQVVATDEDRWSKLSFKLEDLEDAPVAVAKLFDIDAEGVITVSKDGDGVLDYEKDSVYQIVVIVTDNGHEKGFKDLSDTAVITIKIKDADEKPKFDDKYPELAVDENTLKGELVGTVVASDDDCNDNGNCTALVYKLVADDTDKDHLEDYKAFVIDAATGKITVAKDSVLNYEVKDLYKVLVVVYDGDPKNAKTLKDTAFVTININDVNDRPEIKNQEFEIVENVKAGTRIDSVEASDEDHWAKLSYTLLDVEPTDKVAHLFDISSTGIITVSKDGDGVLDYETRKEYKVWVKVTDNGEEKGFENLSDSAIITIRIKDENEPPEIIDDGIDRYEVAENSPNTTFVARYEIKDVDAIDSDFTKDLVISLKDTNTTRNILAEQLFNFNIEKEGDVVYAVIRVAKSPDFEEIMEANADSVFSVVLTLSDQKGAEGCNSVMLTKDIAVNDVNEAPSVVDNDFTPDENLGKGAVIGELEASDLDSLKKEEFGHLEFSIIGADETFPFAMDYNHVIVNNPTKLNYELSVHDYVFNVEVKNCTKDPDTDLYTENCLYDTATVSVKIQDVDERPKIIVDDDDDGDDDTDSLCIAHCEVDSIDRGSHGKNIVTVGVKENSPIGTVVFEYYVYDEDADDVAKLVPTLEQMSTVGTYSDGPTSNDLFEITKKKVGKDRWKIVVTVKDSIDYETLRNAEKNKDPNPQYKVAVVVTDTLDPKNPKSKALSDTIIRVIEIQDVNETPTFVVWPCIIEEHNKIGVSIGHVEHGSDVDSLSPIDKFYKDNRYELIGGDTTLFGLDTNGDVIAKDSLDCSKLTATGERMFICDDSTVYSIDIAYFDKNDTTLKLIRHVPITIVDVNENPWIVTDSISVAEHVKKGTVVDTIVAKDYDLYDTVLTFTLVEDNSGCFQVSKKGVVTVKVDRCAALDYETNKVLPIKVKVTDTKNASETQTVYVKVEDVNEPPSIKDQEIHVSEDAKVNTVIGKVVATDPDIAPKYTTLNYTIISGDSTVFKINPKTGEITLKDTLDYETKKQYKIKVRVDDSEFADTATVTIKVDNVVETSTVIITKFDNPDTTINYPDTVYTNQPDGVISWRQDDDILSMDTTFKPGKNVIVISYKDPTKDKGAKDTIVVMYSNASPVVTVSGDADAVVAENVYTIVEKTDKADTNLYVNERSKDIRVTVKDPANKTDTSFVVSLALESVEVPQKTLDAVSKIAKGGVVVDVTRKGSVRTPVNGTEIKVSYKEIIGKDTVTVSYMTDNDGEPVKVAVINAKGKVDSIEVMTVSYNTVIDGKTVTVSYQADAVTGEVLVKDSNGALMVSGASKSSNSSSSKKGNSSSSTSDGGKGRVTEGMFQITYNTEDALGNSTTISYSVDEKGNVVQNAEGDIGYSVAYTYTNVYGNSATQSVFIVLDQVGPKVEILTPEYGEIIHSNYVKVKWAVNGIEQDTLNMQGLVKGTNYVVRFFRDKAGNEASDTVLVMMKDGKDVDISVEQPVTEVSKEQVDEYYAINPPEEGQNFAVSIRNPSTGKEYETLKGIGSKTKQGSGKEPYPGASGSAHLGPTLALDVHLPTVNAVGGLATLDDLIASDGMITLEGVDAKNGTKVSVQEYVEQYCEEDFELPSDLSQVNLYDSKMIIKVWIYTNLGGFVDYYTFTQDMNDPSFTNDAGMLQMFFEQKVDKDGFVRDQDGKLYATGAYLYKVEATIRSTLRCTLPSEDYDAKTGSFGLNAKKMGDRVKSSDDLLKPFGYKRPSEK